MSHAAAKKALTLLPEIVSKETGLPPSENRLVLKACPNPEAIEGVLKFDPSAFAVVPISNSRRGDVFDYLQFCSYELVAEFRIPISFCLCSLSPLDQITGIVTKRIAFEQIRQDLFEQHPVLRDIDTSRVSDDISTSQAAAIAAKNENRLLGAICSQDAAKNKGLRILIERIERKPIETTFGVFCNAEVDFQPSPKVIDEYGALMRAAHVYSGRHLASGCRGFAELLLRKRPLKVKWGIDPLYSSLHLGHLSNVLKLRDFLNHGHKVVVVMGTFTGIVGDPSGNLTRRPPVDEAGLKKNGETLLRQIEAILGKNSFQVEWNDDLLGKFNLKQFLKWMYDTDIRQIVNRPDFRMRLDFEWGLSVAEFVYPLFQAHDTAQVQPDVEIGGADQLWNCILAKDILKREGLTVPFVLLVDELKGTNGAAKMSSFEGNAIHLDEGVDDIRAKILKVPDTLLPEYFRLLTRLGERDISQMEVALSEGRIESDHLKTRLADEILSVAGPS
jgi:tyrosyl-tRNA synthetase